MYARSFMIEISEIHRTIEHRAMIVIILPVIILS